MRGTPQGPKGVKSQVQDQHQALIRTIRFNASSGGWSLWSDCNPCSDIVSELMACHKAGKMVNITKLKQQCAKRNGMQVKPHCRVLAA
eukprot:4658-Hanusia_phi.AAC.3